MRLATDRFYVATIVVRVILVMTAATRAFPAIFNHIHWCLYITCKCILLTKRVFQHLTFIVKQVGFLRANLAGSSLANSPQLLVRFAFHYNSVLGSLGNNDRRPGKLHV